MSNTMNTPVEVIEHEYPLFVERHELRDGSGGTGHHVGGLGLRRRYRILNPEARLTTMMERCIVPPWGIFGGEAGQPSRVTLERGDTSREVRGKETLELCAGDVVMVETAGGGGYGTPAGRAPDAPDSDDSVRPT